MVMPRSRMLIVWNPRKVEAKFQIGKTNCFVVKFVIERLRLPS